MSRHADAEPVISPSVLNGYRADCSHDECGWYDWSFILEKDAEQAHRQHLDRVAEGLDE